MAISNCLFSPISINPRGFSVWFVLAKFSAKSRQQTLKIISKIKIKKDEENLQNTFNNSNNNKL